MRHMKRVPKLGRTSSHRKAMLANMAASLIKYERIQTTDVKAKALRPYIEKLITLGKRGDLHARRLALARMHDKDAVHKLFSTIAARMAERKGGYTRILKLSRRPGDNAPVSLIEFVDASFQSILSARGMSQDKIDAYLTAEDQIAATEAKNAATEAQLAVTAKAVADTPAVDLSTEITKDAPEA